jgi:hypothetical protein
MISEAEVKVTGLHTLTAALGDVQVENESALAHWERGWG